MAVSQVIAKRRWRHSPKRDGLTSDAVRIIFRDRRDGSIWVRTDHGLDHFREAPFIPSLPLPATEDFGVQAQTDGSAWIGGFREGLWSSSADGRAQQITLPGVTV